MKTSCNSIIASIILLIVILASCRKNEPSRTNNESAVLKKVNLYLPNSDGNEKFKILNIFRDKLAEVCKNHHKSSEVFVDESADTARWKLETTLNTDFANIYDSTLTNFVKNAIQVSISNTGFTETGIPILSGSGIYQAYLTAEESILGANTDTTTFFLAGIELTSFNEVSSFFTINIIIADGPSNHPESHMPVVLRPDETAVPFDNSESYYPYPNHPYPYSAENPNPNWAGAKIHAKLNAHYNMMNVLPNGYMVERKYPDYYGSFTDDPNGNNVYWHNDNVSVKMNANQLNEYLVNYESILDYWNPYGINDCYLAHILVEYTDTYDMWYPPYSYEGFLGYHHWHSLRAEIIKLTAIPDPPDPGGE